MDIIGIAIIMIFPLH